jgi:hypothetical protein
VKRFEPIRSNIAVRMIPPIRRHLSPSTEPIATHGENDRKGVPVVAANCQRFRAVAVPVPGFAALSLSNSVF